MKSFERILELSKTTSQSPERLKLLNQRDGNNKTPLVHAVENGSAAIASALLREGASPLFHELYNADKGWNLLHLASSLPSDKASPELIDTLVKEAGYAVDVEDMTGDTCLHLAAEVGTERIVAALIEIGLPVDSINSKEYLTGVFYASLTSCWTRTFD
jgi:ankyrin repeat protein